MHRSGRGRQGFNCGPEGLVMPKKKAGTVGRSTAIKYGAKAKKKAKPKKSKSKGGY